MSNLKQLISTMFILGASVVLISGCGSESSDVGWNVQPDVNYSDGTNGSRSDVSMSDTESSETDVTKDTIEAETRDAETDSFDSSPPSCEAQTESTCNGRDSDGDGVVDDGCSCQFNDTDRGVCSNGVKTCSGTCEAPETFSENERRCDGKDNDCDGEIDEECVEPDIEAGSEKSCLLKPNGEVRCWGSALEDLPTDIKFKEIELGDLVGCGLTKESTIECWGLTRGDPVPRDEHSDIFVGGSNVCALNNKQKIDCWQTPRLQDPEDHFYEEYIDVALYASHICALKPSGEVSCTGDNDKGQSSSPDIPFQQIVAGLDFTCGLTDTNEVECWGEMHNGPANESELQGKYRSITAGMHYLCGRRQNGEVQCRGDSTDGKLDVPSSDFEQIDSGFNHTCGITESDDIKCWGDTTSNPPPNLLP